MRLFIDCEWNGFGGELISMALVPESERFAPFYMVLGCHDPIPWVAEHVMPVLGPHVWAGLDDLQAELARYLSRFATVHVVADWPEDIERFCKLLITGPGTRINTPPLTMEVLRVDPVSKVPHNALEDARALRDAVLARQAILANPSPLSN